MKPLTSIYLLALANLFNPVAAQDELDLDGARIFRNRDLPNITYIVPWKDDKPEMVEIQPIGSLFDEALQPIDRDVFKRELEYYELLQNNP